MKSFADIFNDYNFSEVLESIRSKTSADVEQTLNAERPDLEGMKALLSPAAGNYLEQMAMKSRDLTRKRFGKTIQMYVPLYLSNECQNICTYCGFSFDNKIKRITLTETQLMKEVGALKGYGYDHVLLVTGESSAVALPYFEKMIKLLRPHFSHIAMEVQPMETEEYRTLIDAGLHTVLVYQETYHREGYSIHHPKGKKSRFDYRLETPERLGNAGIGKIGLGVLLGLEDWRADSFFTAMHLAYLEKKYWQTKFSISFPRLRPFSGGLDPKVEMNDRELLQLICAYRIFDQEVELSLSTRESPNFRNHMVQLGITSMSAGSRTDPGGYANSKTELEQFEINDERTPSEVAAMIRQQGYEPVWKDWEKVLV